MDYRVTPQMRYIFNQHNIVQLGGDRHGWRKEKKLMAFLCARYLFLLE